MTTEKNDYDYFIWLAIFVGSISAALSSTVFGLWRSAGSFPEQWLVIEPTIFVTYYFS